MRLALLPLAVLISFITPLRSEANVRCAAFDEPILRFEIKSDFKKIYDERANNAGEIRAQDPSLKPVYTPATVRDLSHPDVSFRAQIRARGNSSLEEGEADFPKLRISLDKEQNTKGTAFEDSRKFRLNTHISDKKAKTEMGRVTGDLAPQRESLAYRFAEIIGLFVPNPRLAQVTYVDSKSRTRSEHFALMLDTNKKIGERLGAKEIDEVSFADSESSGIHPVTGAKFYLFQKIIGNSDVFLRVNAERSMLSEVNRQAWNVLIFEKAKGERVPVVYDLDMAKNVVGVASLEELKAPFTDFGLTTLGSREIALQIAPLFEHFTKAQLRSAAKEILAKKFDLYQAALSARVDPEGRDFALASLDRFFYSIDAVLSLPVLAKTGVQFFGDVRGRKSKLRENTVTSEPGTLRLGTPVKVLAKEGAMLKVQIIDIKGELDEGESPVGYIKADSKIANSLSKAQVRHFDLRDMTL